MPKVSVIIPTHNRPHLVGRAIRSVLNQTFQDFEIIVVDDGLEKRAYDTVADFHDDRIVYLRHGHSMGGAVARNTGITHAKGEFIAFLDDDDEWLPEKLERQVGAFDMCDEGVSVVFCGVSVYDLHGTLLYEALPEEEGVVRPLKRLLHRCYIWTSSIMMRREYRDRGGMFDIALKKNQEWDLLVRLAKESSFFAINEPLTRLHVLREDEHMGGSGNIDNIIQGYEVFLAKHRDKYNDMPRSLALHYFRLGMLYRDNHKFSKARQYWFRAWKLQPTNVLFLRHLAVSLLGTYAYSFLQDVAQ